MDDVTLTREQKKHIALLDKIGPGEVVSLFGEWIDRCIEYKNKNPSLRLKSFSELWWYEKFVDGFQHDDAVLLASSSVN